MSKKLIVELSDRQYEILQSIPYGSIASRIILDRVKKGVPFEDREKGEWIEDHEVNSVTCKDCGCFLYPNDIEGRIAYCPTCGRDMR